MTFEKVVMTDSKTVLFRGLMAMNLEGLPTWNGNKLTRIEEIRVHEELYRRDIVGSGGPFPSHRDAELRLRDPNNGKSGGVLKLRAIAQYNDLFQWHWRLDKLQLLQYSKGGPQFKHQWHTTGGRWLFSESLPKPGEGELVDREGRLYKAARNDVDFFAEDPRSWQVKDRRTCLRSRKFRSL